MDSIQNTVYYCCIVKEGEIMYTYSNGDYEIESLAALCLEKMIPPFHKWYFQTMNHMIFGFLMEESFVYFAISDESLGNSGVYKFLELVMNEFRKAVKNSLRRNTTSVNALALQEQFLPVFHRLIMSLNEPITTVSMEIPLLGMSGKLNKNKTTNNIEERLISVRDVEGSSGRGEVVCLTGSEMARKKWYREIRIVVAIDVGVCLVLFAVWMIICNGFKCIR